MTPDAQPREQSELVRLPDRAEVSPLLEELISLLRQNRMTALKVMTQVRESLAGTILETEATLLAEVVERLEFTTAQERAKTVLRRLAEITTQHQ